MLVRLRLSAHNKNLSEFVEAHTYEFNILQAKASAGTRFLISNLIRTSLKCLTVYAAADVELPSSHSAIDDGLEHIISLINQRLDTLTASHVQTLRLSTMVC